MGTIREEAFTLKAHLMTISSIGIGTMLLIGMGLLCMMNLTIVQHLNTYILRGGSERQEGRSTYQPQVQRAKAQGTGHGRVCVCVLWSGGRSSGSYSANHQGRRSAGMGQLGSMLQDVQRI